VTTRRKTSSRVSPPRTAESTRRTTDALVVRRPARHSSPVRPSPSGPPLRKSLTRGGVSPSRSSLAGQRAEPANGGGGEAQPRDRRTAQLGRGAHFKRASVARCHTMTCLRDGPVVRPAQCCLLRRRRPTLGLYQKLLTFSKARTGDKQAIRSCGHLPVTPGSPTTVQHSPRPVPTRPDVAQSW
jgi:hypothetical protein